LKTKDKQNKHKLKFDYISTLQILGKIWKEHCKLVDSKIFKNDNLFNQEVVKQMGDKAKSEYSSALAKCDDIFLYLGKIDISLKKSHQKFSSFKKYFK
tara:strand:+ start:180 stop:473 length:294 start_codon:yes stop_codon:yes gene_type:complete